MRQLWRAASAIDDIKSQFSCFRPDGAAQIRRSVLRSDPLIAFGRTCQTRPNAVVDALDDLGSRVFKRLADGWRTHMRIVQRGGGERLAAGGTGWEPNRDYTDGECERMIVDDRRNELIQAIHDYHDDDGLDGALVTALDRYTDAYAADILRRLVWNSVGERRFNDLPAEFYDRLMELELADHEVS